LCETGRGGGGTERAFCGKPCVRSCGAVCPSGVFVDSTRPLAFVEKKLRVKVSALGRRPVQVRRRRQLALRPVAADRERRGRQPQQRPRSPGSRDQLCAAAGFRRAAGLTVEVRRLGSSSTLSIASYAPAKRVAVPSTVQEPRGTGSAVHLSMSGITPGPSPWGFHSVCMHQEGLVACQEVGTPSLL
jgi:hypothetical protein